jgi:anti-anti-sigma factor
MVPHPGPRAAHRILAIEFCCLPDSGTRTVDPVDTLASVIVDEKERSATFSGEIDLASYEELTVAVSALLELPGDLDCDMADVTFIDSSGIRLFVQMQRSRDERSAVIIHRAKANVARVFELAGVTALGIQIERSG